MDPLIITKNKNNKEYNYRFLVDTENQCNLRPDLNYDYIAEKLSELDIDGIRVTPIFCRFYTDHNIEDKLKECFDCHVYPTHTDGKLKYAFELRFDNNLNRLEEKIIQNL